MKMIILVCAAISLLAGLACGGGSNEPEVVRVPIHRLNFDGMELTLEDLNDLPFADAYPAIVAEVNGEPISGQALAQRQVMQELSRRDASTISEELFRDQMLANIESIDPLEKLIDDALQRQAIERLGLRASDEEAVEYAKTHEASVTQPRATVSLEAYRQIVSNMKFEREACPTATAAFPLTPGVNFRGSPACDEFLRKEREDAEIVYYVVWAD